MVVFNFIKSIFTWWNRQTIGTFFYTLISGKFIGEDKFGNKYYSNSKGKRWVIYKDYIESSKIPPEWHSWIHFLSRKTPEKNEKKFSWQKEHHENFTGTDKAFKPEGSLISGKKKKNRQSE